MDKDSMNTIASYIKEKGIENEIELAAKLSGFAYVGDYLQNIFDKEIKKAKMTAELKKELQKGIDSGFVEVGDEFFRDMEKRLGVVGFDYED